MKREKKYYVSEKKKDGGYHRLTNYFKTELEARAEQQRRAVYYDCLVVRALMPDNKTRITL